jgi:hypothetical protein
MPSSPIPRTPAGFVEAARVFSTLDTPSARTAAGLTEADFEELDRSAAAVGTTETAQADAERAARAATAAAEQAADRLEEVYRRLRRKADANLPPDDALRDAAGIGTRDATRSPGELPVPEKVEALRRPSGAVFVDWEGPSGGSLRYEVACRDEAAGGESVAVAGAEWRVLDVVSGTDFTDRTAAPGTFRRYRVTARRGERRGEPSAEVSVGS